MTNWFLLHQLLLFLLLIWCYFLASLGISRVFYSRRSFHVRFYLTILSIWNQWRSGSFSIQVNTTSMTKTSDYITRNTNERTRQGSNSSFNIPKTRLKRTDDNFWTRNGTLHNILSKHIDLTRKVRKFKYSSEYHKYGKNFRLHNT